MALIYQGGEPVIRIANEFTTVHVSRSRTGNGERLLIASPGLGHSVHLDPLQLECLTWQSPEMYSDFLFVPHGPNASLKSRPLSELINERTSWAF